MPLSAGAPLEERDGLGLALPNQRHSEHFAIKWGSAGTLEEARIGALLEALERSFEIGLNQHGLRPPVGAERFLVNIYIGNTGDGAPEIPFEGGYMSVDPEGFAFVVLSELLLGDGGSYDETSLGSVAVHEFHHVLEHASGAYASQTADPSFQYWFWEASATWFQAALYPDDGLAISFMALYLLKPHLPLNYCNPEAENPIEASHQYTASLFLQHLTEHGPLPDIAIRAWREGTADDDPLMVLDRLLGEAGSTLREAFDDFSARNAAFDYAHGLTMKTFLDRYTAWRPQDDQQLALTLADSSDWSSPLVEFMPGALGYNLVRLDVPAETTRSELSFEATFMGSLGSLSRFDVTLIELRPTGPVYQRLAPEGLLGRFVVAYEPGVERLVALASVPARNRRSEVYEYRLRLEPLPEEADDTGGCSTGGTPGAQGLLALALLVFRARPKASRRPGV